MWAVPWLPAFAAGTVGFCSWRVLSIQGGGGRPCVRSFPALTFTLIMALQSWPGIECRRRLRSHSATRPPLPPPGTQACTQVWAPGGRGWGQSFVHALGLYETNAHSKRISYLAWNLLLLRLCWDNFLLWGKINTI